MRAIIQFDLQFSDLIFAFIRDHSDQVTARFEPDADICFLTIYDDDLIAEVESWKGKGVEVKWASHTYYSGL